MRIYRSLAEAEGRFGPSALTVGNFDGVHAGHQYIFERVTELGREHGWTPSVLTFDPHPATVLAPERAPRLLSTPEQRAAWMGEKGIEQALILSFDRAFSQLTAEHFVEQILVAGLGARAVLVGRDFRFGRGALGDAALLRRLGGRFEFRVEIMPPVRLRGRVVSSSEIRRLIEGGNVALATRLFGRFYSLEGCVVAGHGIGSRQTVPTLNLSTTAEVLPARGVYVTRTLEIDGGRRWPSVTNVGYRPTFGGEQLAVETHLLAALDCETPERIRVEFLHRLREERKFENVEDLKAQIFRDSHRARAWFRRYARWVESAPLY